jgi:hypothetical protein
VAVQDQAGSTTAAAQDQTGSTTLAAHTLIVLKSGSLNLLEPSGFVQTSPWIAVRTAC